MKSILFMLATLVVSANAHAVNPVDGLPEQIKQKHLAISGDDCQTDLPAGAEIHDIGHGKKLYIVPCVMGAYQGSSRAYIGTPESFEQVIALAYDERTKGITGSLDLGEASYNPKTKILSTFAKGRGIGDCGQSSESKVLVPDEYTAAVKTVEIRAKVKCDGRMSNWPVVYRQK